MDTGAGCGTARRRRASARPQPVPTRPGPLPGRCLPAGNKLAKMVNTKQIMMAPAAGVKRGPGLGVGPALKGAAARPRLVPASWSGEAVRLGLRSTPNRGPWDSYV